MKKIIILTILLTVLSASMAFGATIQFTADNNLTGFTLNGVDATTLGTLNGNTGDWTKVKTYDFTYNNTQSLDLSWDIQNYKIGTTVSGVSNSFNQNNPMAFIAQIDFNGDGIWDMFSNLETNSPWSIDATGTNYASANTDPNAWNHKLSGFDGAYWLGSTGVDKMTVNLSIPASPTPIPGAIWLLGSGLIGMVGIRKRFQA